MNLKNYTDSVTRDGQRHFTNEAELDAYNDGFLSAHDHGSIALQTQASNYYMERDRLAFCLGVQDCRTQQEKW